MGRLLNIVTPLHKMTKRDYIGRMTDDKINCSIKAREYEADYWDGDRRYGYGGYRFIEGRWAPVAQALIDIYRLKNGEKLLPGLEVTGFDISQHGLANAHEAVRANLFTYRAQDPYPFGDDHFDLVI